LHASACFRIRSRYSALNRRRWGLVGTPDRGPPRARPWKTLRYGPPRFARRPSAPALPRATGPPAPSGTCSSRP
jgi:hypothetical protein